VGAHRCGAVVAEATNGRTRPAAAQIAVG